MCTDAALPGRLTLLEPPYSGSAQPLAAMPGSHQVRLPPGTVVALQMHRPIELDRWLLEGVQSLRRRFPTAPLILILPECNAEVVILAGHAARLGVRAVLCGELDIPVNLRRLLAQPSELAGDAVDWLVRVRGVRIPLRARELVRDIIENAPQHHSVGDVLNRLIEPGAAARAYFRAHQLPPPGGWFHLGRALRAALTIQRRPGEPLMDLALHLGYSDAASLSRQLQRLFGTRPTRVREALGWEWLLDRWWERAAKRTAWGA